MKTWNPITGCLHNCTYCWAKGYAKRLAAWGTEPYKTHGFRPAFAEWRLRKRFQRDDIFVSDMGDMWGKWVPKEWIERVLRVLRSKPDSHFFFLTKNPQRYHEFQDEFRENMLLGATIETNRDYPVSEAPAPRERYIAMKRLRWNHKAIVIEPILDFDQEFIDWIREIAPETISIGYDNYHNRLPEPALHKTTMLIRTLQPTLNVTAKALRPAWYESE